MSEGIEFRMINIEPGVDNGVEKYAVTLQCVLDKEEMKNMMTVTKYNSFKVGL